MADIESKQASGGGGSDPFDTTQWSVVVAAGQNSSPEAHEALEVLCQKYWGPLYAFVRRRNYSVEDAQDITQGFFARFLERGSIGEASRERGKFRAYLLTALKHYMVDGWRREQAHKRGAGQATLSLDFDAAEGSYGLLAADETTPETMYEQGWAVTMLNGILGRLEREYAGAGKTEVFGKLKPSLTGEDSGATYAQLAGELGMTEGAVKVAVHRLRKRFGALLRGEIAQTVADAEDIEDEIQHLFTLFR